MLEYRWLFTLFLSSARCRGEVDSAPTYLATIFLPLMSIFVLNFFIMNPGWSDMPIPAQLEASA